MLVLEERIRSLHLRLAFIGLTALACQLVESAAKKIASFNDGNLVDGRLLSTLRSDAAPC